MTHPETAILLATYNGSSYISDFLQSLSLQSYKNFCLYVRDDGSSDGTLNLVRSYSANLNIKIIPSKGRVGAASSFFNLMNNSDGHSYYLFADQDDVWHPDKIDRTVGMLSKFEADEALYFSRFECVDKELFNIRYSLIPKFIDFKNATVESIALGCTIGFTSRLRNGVLSANPHGYVMHDWWLYLYATSFGKVIYDPVSTIKYRQHDSNTIGISKTPLKSLFSRLLRFAKSEGGIHGMPMQSKSFIECYRNKMQQEQINLLRILAGDASVLTKMKAICSNSFYRQSKVETFVIKALLLLGRL